MQSPPTLKKFSVLVPCGANLLTSDGIEYEGKLWLVPKWHNLLDGGVRPALMIRFDNLEHQNRAIDHNYQITIQVPTYVLDGTSLDGYETLSGSDTPLYIQEKRTVH